MAEPTNPELSAEMSDLIAPTETKIDPKFTKTLLVDDDNTINLYGDFITQVRNAVKEHCRTQTGIVPPVLPPEKKKPDSWFHIVLQTNTSFIKLAIRMDNLYLVGFQTPKPHEVWWEFGKNGDTHLLDDNPRWLGFRGGYPDLIGDKGLDTVTLGRVEMAGAVNYLAKKTMTLEEEEELLLQGADQAASSDDEPPQADPKSMLAMLVIMVCEGLRFSTVSDKIDEGFEIYQAVKLTQMQGKQVLKWDRISKALFTWAKDPTAKIPEMEEIGIKTKKDAEEVVALVKDQN